LLPSIYKYTKKALKKSTNHRFIAKKLNKT